ncbi:MAG TPA: glutathione synthase [Gammaproteobacteria bacterium]|nr:glutathione synthase [Gammaproteobacteria bacterium]
MSKRLGILMDPIEHISYKKDSTLAMLWEASKRGWSIDYFEMSDLYVENGIPKASARKLEVFQNPEAWFNLSATALIELADLDVILMRKDPPFDAEYIYATYILEFAEALGTLVVNKPQSLRDANEKIFTAWFPEMCPPFLFSRNMDRLREFYKQEKDVIIKPPHGMGGQSIFRIQPNDPNASVIFESLTQHGTELAIVQKYIPEITKGDKRILMIDGEPVPYALARIPAQGETRGNLAAGGTGKAVKLSARDQEICARVGPTLREKGLIFVGLDVIGDYLTEVNVTSPTCVRELDSQCNLNICADLFDVIEKY